MIKQNYAQNPTVAQKKCDCEKAGVVYDPQFYSQNQALSHLIRNFYFLNRKKKLR